ncbi:hypothetical protein CDAR_25501 [Caerostris darwini]|uniref:Uncharacterized protein n=1 Tax=Caerostris darwini TaxID=1538125 RepID=A0AAV4TYY4_9ARAC|nr:hypothetical protein CDAR_25501 [Caerostris darwini]
MYPHNDERTLFIHVPFLSIFLRKHLQQYSLRALTEKESLFSVKIRGAPPSITPAHICSWASLRTRISLKDLCRFFSSPTKPIHRALLFHVPIKNSIHGGRLKGILAFPPLPFM